MNQCVEGVPVGGYSMTNETRELGNLSILMDIYQMKRECTPPEALLLYNWLSDFINGKDVQYITNQQWPGKYKML